MLMLDLRNSWPNPLSISLQVRPFSPEGVDTEESWGNSYTVNEVIQPGHINRIVVVLPKIYLSDPFAPIPSLNPANQRQFVVSMGKISPELERGNREAFWYRHELLKLTRGTWKEESNGRHGEIELRGMRFSPRMVESIKLEDVLIETHVEPDYQTNNANSVRQIGRTKFEIHVDDFVTLTTKVFNRSPRPISPILRLQPYLAGLPHNVALDLDKRFSWSGVLQRKLPVLQPGETCENELGVVALCSGIFEVGATVEEAEILESEKVGQGNRARSDTATRLQADILGEQKLRVWHLKEPCTIDAKRRTSE